MKHRNLPVINLRKSYSVKDAAANINGYRNAIFLPGAGRYKGMWKNNLREGLGTFSTSNGLTFEGNWENDRKHGYGLLKKTLKTQRARCAPIYDGEWKDDKRTGGGTAYFENGFYEGQWKNGCRDGSGIMLFDDGSYYIGEWQSGLYHGIGAHNDVHAGTLYRGYFVAGKRCGEGTLHFLHKRKIMKGVWKDGVCVTSVLQDETENENAIPLGRPIPKIGLADPVGVLSASLENENKLTDQLIKSKVKKPNVNFDCFRNFSYGGRPFSPNKIR